MSATSTAISDLPHALAADSRERKGDEFLDDLDEAEQRLRADIGVSVERRRYAIAVHARRAPDDLTRQLAAAVVSAVTDHMHGLRVTGGKEIEEFRPLDVLADLAMEEPDGRQ